MGIWRTCAAMKAGKTDGTANRGAGTLGGLAAFWAGRDEATSLHGDAQNRLAEPAPSPLCLAHPQPGLLRWLRAGHAWLTRLDDGGHPPLHGAPQPAPAQHDGGDALGAAAR